MATQTATRLMRCFPQRYGMNSSWKQTLIHARRNYYTGDRYQGYVSFFQPDELFGFVVREDLPDKEYYFHSTDLHTRNVPRVRPLQEVEFSIVEGRGGNYIARDVTGPNSTDLEFNHANMRLAQSERSQCLSHLPNGLHERHKGVVVTIHADGSGGLIVPDRLNFQVCSFRMSELQSTGFEKIDRFSEVEFFVRPARFEGARDRAICITRPGGGLITGERKDIGSRRRQLGAMYGPNDMKARLAGDWVNDRKRGIVVDYHHDKLYGFIASVDDPSETSIFVHCDDCHIAGKRILRRHQLVEYVPITDQESGRTKALHVTGPNQSVLHNISPNHYLPKDLTTLEFDADNTTRHLGSVVQVARQIPKTWFMVKPCDRGYKSLIGFRGDLQCLGRREVEAGDLVEFSVEEFVPNPRTDDDSTNEDKSTNHEENDDNETRYHATSVTCQGGYPILTQKGKYGRYLQSKLKLPFRQADLPPAPLSTENTVVGYIAGYSRAGKTGTVEIEAPAGQRYQKAKFSIDDCILENNVDLDRAMINSGILVKCNILEHTDLTDEEKESAERGGTVLQRKAANITTVDLDYLQVREWRDDFAGAGMGFDQDLETTSKPLASSTTTEKEKTISL